MSRVLLGEKVENITFEELSIARQETNFKGEPKYGVLLADLINHISNQADKANLKPVINKLEATRIEFVNSPLQDGKPIFEPKDLNLAVIKDVFATIDFTILQDMVNGDNAIMSCGIIWTEKGIKVGFGPKIEVCQNMCIMGSDYIYKAGVRGINELMTMNIPQIIGKSEKEFENGMKFLSGLSERFIDIDEYAKIIGELHLLRYTTTSKKYKLDHPVYSNEKFDSPILLNGELNTLTEKGLQRYNETNGSVMSAYDMYNDGTALLKPGKVQLGGMFETNAVFSEYFKSLSYGKEA